MRNREAIIPAGMESVYDKIGYAPAIKVGDTVYVSGQIGRDAGMQLVEGREAQIVQAFENLKRVLEAGGATLDDVVDLTTFHTDMRDLPLFMQVRDRYFHAHPRPAGRPSARTCSAARRVTSWRSRRWRWWSGEHEARDVRGRRLVVCTGARDAGQSRDGAEIAGTSGRDDAMSPPDCVAASNAIGDGRE